jgi:hypothetical protein
MGRTREGGGKMSSIQDSFLLPGESTKDTGVSMIVYGSPGAGKTSLIKTLLGWTYEKGWGSQKPYCDPKDIFVISIDAGTTVLEKDNKNVVTIFPVHDTLEKFKEIIQYLKESNPFKFVWLDNVSELEKFFVLALAKQKGLDLPRQKEWGDASVYVRKYLRELRDLVFQGTSIIFNFWDMIVKIEDKDGSVQSLICPMCMSKTWTEYIGLVDHYAYLGIHPKTGERFMQFEDHGMIKAKTRSDKIGVRPDGTVSPGKFERANLASIFIKLKGEADVK